MDERLLIEATPELLEGWCGPVVFRWDHHGPKRAYMVSWDGDLYDDCGPVDDPDQYRDGLLLDLSRAECRDRVARVAARKRMAAGDALCFVAGGDTVALVALEDGHSVTEFGIVAAPAADDTRLPDGSRLVDALALAAVWREVASG